MPTASITGVILDVTGLTIGQQYAMRLFCRYPGNTYYTDLNYRQPSSGTIAASTTKWSFNISNYVGNPGTYDFYVHIYAPGQDPQNFNTNTVSYTVVPQTIKVMVYNYLLGGTALTDGSYTGSKDGIFYINYRGTQYQTYSVQYEFQYFRMASDGYQGVYGINSGIPIQEGQEVHAYYKKRITYVTITGYCGTGVASFRMSSSGGSYQTVTATSGGVQSMQIVSGETVNFTQLTPLAGYDAPYSLYYNRSGQPGWFGPATEFNITDTSFDRLIRITATKKAIPYFSWTTDDATKIAPGQPVRNITASAWNDLISKIAACGGDSNSVYTAYPGSTITANHFKSMRNGISGLAGAGDVPPDVTAGTSKILASLFIGLKNAINRAISYKNST